MTMDMTRSNEAEDYIDLVQMEAEAQVHAPQLDDRQARADELFASLVRAQCRLEPLYGSIDTPQRDALTQ